jgi:hypothetical protein
MFDKLIQYLKRFDYPVSTNSLALFRILYALYNIGIIFQLYAHWPIYFDAVVPFSISLFPAKLVLFVWLISSTMLLLGLFHRIAAVANYVMIVLVTSFFVNAALSTFNDDLLRIGGFLLIILPVCRSFSIDAIFKRLSTSSKKYDTSYLYYLLSIVVSLGLLYFGSGFSKLFSPMWQKGLGLWVPAVIPSYHWHSFDFFVNQQWLMVGLNYFVILFELSFAFLVFRKRLHIWLAFIGIGFHLGIAFLFPFTYISFGPILFYALFIPDSWWLWLKQLIASKHPLRIVYNPNNIKHSQAIQFLSAFNFRGQFEFIEQQNSLNTEVNNFLNWNILSIACKRSALLFPVGLIIRLNTTQNLLTFVSETWLPDKLNPNAFNPGLYRFKRFAFFVFVGALCGIQLLTISYHTYTVVKDDKNKKMAYYKLRFSVQDFSTKPSNLARTFFGINSRGLFLDQAFRGSKTIFSIALVKPNGNEHWLPIFDKEGYCREANRNFAWSKFSFNYLASTPTQPDTSSLKKYTWYWAKKNHVSVDNCTFRVYRKIYPLATHFEKDYLPKMLALPWDTMGVIQWNDSIFSYQNLKPDSIF